MVGKTISHHNIFEKLGEVPKWLTPACRNIVPIDKNHKALRRAGTSASQRVIAILRIPACLVGTIGAGSLPAHARSLWQAGPPKGGSSNGRLE